MINIGFVSDGLATALTMSRLWIITEGDRVMAIQKKHDRLVAIHPGEFLREDYLKPLGMSASALAMALRVPVTRISEIVNERRGISADTALRLARYFGTSAEYWMNMQKAYELAQVIRDFGPEIEKQVERRAA
jgi:addiction module HigA family antidote